MRTLFLSQHGMSRTRCVFVYNSIGRVYHSSFLFNAHPQDIGTVSLFAGDSSKCLLPLPRPQLPRPLPSSTRYSTGQSVRVVGPKQRVLICEVS